MSVQNPKQECCLSPMSMWLNAAKMPVNSIAAEKQTKTVILPMSYTTLAEYLSVDRSAMMREMKNLADEGIIERDGKKLRILDWK